MYNEYWGFTRSPFSGVINPQRFYEGPGYEEALARLAYVLDESRQGALLLGPAGTGKTLLATVFAERARRPDREVVIARGSALGGRELFFELCQECGLAPDRSASEADLWRALREHVATNRINRCQTVFVIDQVQWLADSAAGLRSLHLLFQLDLHPESQLTAVLIARPELMRVARSETLELVDLGIVLEPFSAEQTGQYISYLTKWAGRADSALSPDAIERIHELTGGVARQINRVADLALLAGATEALDLVTAHVVDSVFNELNPDTAVERLAVAV